MMARIKIGIIQYTHTHNADERLRENLMMWMFGMCVYVCVWEIGRGRVCVFVFITHRQLGGREWGGVSLSSKMEQDPIL